VNAIRRAKIVCTLGPATRDVVAIRALVEAGMDVARLNLSHGTREEHAACYRAVRQASDDTQRAVGILVDLQGPKIRLGSFAGGRVRLDAGAEFTITTEEVAGDARRASTTYADLANDVRPGDTVLIDDGNVRLEVIDREPGAARCRVIEGGVVSDHKGINLPGVHVSAPALTEKDIADLRFALGLRADFVALSFVRRATDVDRVREVMQAAGGLLPVIAKIEKPEAVERLEEIVQAFDGIMVARGDLGVEMPLERVPLIQKRALRLARELGRPAIVATQMLESMVHASHPTRAETSDVANAVFDGADAVMLSAETSIGEFPVEAVRTMARIGAEAAQDPAGAAALELRSATRADAIAAAAARLAVEIDAKAIVAYTLSGGTVRRLARHRPGIPLLAFTSEAAVRSQLTMVWGVETFVVPLMRHTDEMVAAVDRALVSLGRAAQGDSIVIVAGTPPGTLANTNTIHVHRIGDPTGA
jgi:pyruvate kinase